jgi:hypothetical protein
MLIVLLLFLYFASLRDGATVNLIIQRALSQLHDKILRRLRIALTSYDTFNKHFIFCKLLLIR